MTRATLALSLLMAVTAALLVAAAIHAPAAIPLTCGPCHA